MATIHQILQQYWKYSHFRPQQQEIVEAVIGKNDVLALLPTGGGKSLCYQLPAVAMQGVCLVVSPLVALMKDQVEALRAKNIPAEAIYSGLNYKEVDRILDNCVYGHVKLLYVAPERLKSELFLERFRRMNICLLAVDEAHCISEWGYDFRPAYFNIHTLRELKPQVPCIALTATATPKVEEDIKAKLALKKPQVFKASYARPNLVFSCVNTEMKARTMLEHPAMKQGRGIVYARSRKATKELTMYFLKNCIPTTFYHAGLSHHERQEAMQKWTKGGARVMVATNAFGMGIDKDDVRFVFHYDLPESLEAYYQEAGRAGRDGKEAHCVLFYFDGDIQLAMQKLESSFPPIEYIRNVYQLLANYYQLAVGSAELEAFDFDFDDFRSRYKLEVVPCYNALKKLEEEGYIHLNESFYTPSKVYIPISYEQLYEFQVKYPRLDPFIKSLLRMYGGDLFTHFTMISESKLAKLMQLAVSELVSNLEVLHKQGILCYQPTNSKPKLTFLTPRYDARNLPLNKRKMDELKQRKVHKQEEMIHYAKADRMCRIAFILEYFGEEHNAKCGKCDNCLAKS